VRSLQRQAHSPLQILLIPNGADDAIRRLCSALSDADPRIRVLCLPQPGLAAALNAGLRSAAFDLIARMDADDECPPERIGRQVAFLATNPRIAGVGTAFGGEDENGAPLGVDRPCTDPAEIRWRLMLGNLFCHGSMVLRRDATLRVGGYDESFRFAQDYDLWLRLSRVADLANLPEVLYHYRASMSRRHHEQAAAASTAMLKAWSGLPEPTPEMRTAIGSLLAQSTWGGASSRQALAAIRDLLSDSGPTREALLAYQLIAQRAGIFSDTKLDRLRDAGRRIREAGVASVWLYGAGRHTTFVMDNLDVLALEIAGIAEDHLAGAERFGRVIAAPGEVPDNAEVLLSSDAHEDRLYDASLPLRARGARVWRIYGISRDDAATPRPGPPASIPGSAML
jgi:hypothetical protein